MPGVAMVGADTRSAGSMPGVQPAKMSSKLNSRIEGRKTKRGILVSFFPLNNKGGYHNWGEAPTSNWALLVYRPYFGDTPQ